MKTKAKKVFICADIHQSLEKLPVGTKKLWIEAQKTEVLIVKGDSFETNLQPQGSPEVK